MSAPILLDFHDQPSAIKALKKVAQYMQRAGQPVVSHDFSPKITRTSGVGYREALLTLASGQTVALRVTQTGDIFQVLLNGTVKPIKSTDPILAIGEIARMAEANQAAFQKKQARVKVELPKGIKTAAPRLEVALQARVSELDTQIAERQAQVADLKAELGESVLDAAVLDAAKKHNQKGYAFYVVAKGKIESGWEYNDDAKEHKADNMPDQLKAGAKIYRAGGLKALGLDPNDNAAWLTTAALDGVGEQPKGFPKLWDDGLFYNRDQFDLVPTDEHGEMPPAWVLIAGAVPNAPVLDSTGSAPEAPDLPAALALAESITSGTVLDSADTSAAVATLRIALETVETNHVINMSEGNLEQAGLEKDNAESFRAALAILDAAEPEQPPIPQPDEAVPSKAGDPAIAAADALQNEEPSPPSGNE